MKKKSFYKRSWSYVGKIISLLGIVITVSIFVWTEIRNPYDLQMSLESEINLIDINESIPGLKIEYNSQDLLDTKSIIKVLRIHIRNVGDVITMQHYDKEYPIGLKFTNSRILKAEVNRASDDYIKNKILQNYNHEVYGLNEDSIFVSDLKMGKLILNSGDFAQLEITLLISNNNEYKIQPYGKVANIQQLKVTDNLIADEEKKILDNKQLFFYLLLSFFVLMTTIFSTLTYFEEKKLKKKKKKAVSYLENHQNLSDVEKRIVDIYINEWEPLYSSYLSYLMKKYEVIDIRNYVEDVINSMKSHYEFTWSKARRDLKQISLPTEIFNLDGNVVTLNNENKEFVIEFFSEMGEVDSKKIDKLYFDHS